MCTNVWWSYPWPPFWLRQELDESHYVSVCLAQFCQKYSIFFLHLVIIPLEPISSFLFSLSVKIFCTPVCKFSCHIVLENCTSSYSREWVHPYLFWQAHKSVQTLGGSPCIHYLWLTQGVYKILAWHYIHEAVWRVSESVSHPVPSTVFCVTTCHQPLTTLLFNGDTFCVYWIKLVTNYFLSPWTFYFMFWKMSVWGPLLGYPLTKTKWCQFMQVILYKTNIEIIASQNCHRHNFPLTGQIKQFKSKNLFI